jgi:hypothetical protein
MAPVFSLRGRNWTQQQLPHYDLAFYMSPRPETEDGRDTKAEKLDEKGVRGSFLKLFVALLKDYRECFPLSSLSPLLSSLTDVSPPSISLSQIPNLPFPI